MYVYTYTYVYYHTEEFKNLRKYCYLNIYFKFNTKFNTCLIINNKISFLKTIWNLSCF